MYSILGSVLCDLLIVFVCLDVEKVEENQLIIYNLCVIRLVALKKLK